MAIDINAQGNRLFIHEMPVKKGQGSYEAVENRVRIINLDTQETLRTFTAPRQVMSMASSKDGKRLYVFSVGQDIFVYDTETGEHLDTLPLLSRAWERVLLAPMILSKSQKFWACLSMFGPLA